MKKVPVFIAAVLFFSLLSFPDVKAQHLSPARPVYQSGYIQIPFNTNKGEINILLTDDFFIGGKISGTTKIIPSGKNIKRQLAAADELKKYSLQMGDQKVPLDSDVFSCTLENKPGNATVTLLDAQGNAISQIKLNEPIHKITAIKNCTLPTHALVGEPFAAIGNFDGNSANTICSLDNKPVQVLAESATKCILQYPGNVSGKQLLNIQEFNQPGCIDTISSVTMQLTTGKTSLIKGETTWLDIVISGINNLKDEARLSVTNNSAKIITLEGGSDQVYRLKPLDNKSNQKKESTLYKKQDENGIPVNYYPVDIYGSQNNWTKHLTITSIQSGDYSVNVNLQLPQPATGSASGDSLQFDNGNTTPTGPGGNGETEFKCNCDVKVRISPTADKGNKMFFKAIVSPGCSGVCGKAVNTVTLCNSDPAATVLLWSVKDGKENAVIKGAANTDNIEVERKNNKAFTLTVKVTITCSCNLICAAEDELVIPESPDTKAPMCGIKMQEYAEPKMYGGLIDDYKMDKKEINRDDYIALGAEGKDFDILSLICEPVKPDCEDVQETKRINLNSSVRFEWNIINGNGSFVKIGRLPLNNINTDGDRVIFKPPYVTLPGKPLDTNSVVSNVILSVIDDNPGQAQDDRVDREITIITSRVKNKPDKYIVSVIPLKAEGKMPQPFKADSDPGTCHVILKEPPWTHLNNLKAPVIQLPNIPGSDTIVNGEWVILTVDDQDDTDSLIASCKSTGSVPPCSNNGIKLGYADKINYKWRITGKTADKLRGRFIKANGDSYQQVEEITAGTVIYEAPADLQDNDFVTVTIACNAFNPETDRTDNESPSGKITLRIYKGGVKLSPVPLAWLPESGNKVKLNSTLCVSDKKEEWETAPQHFARIHFFELTPVSNEKGICMNAPLLQNANECRDLKLSNDTVSHEAYDSLPIKTCPDNSNYFVKARSSIIEHDYAINVFSEDYGGYGYLTSYADIRSLQPETKTIKKANYSSIPLQKGEAKHPGSFVGKSGNRDGNFDFADNRVSIPQDLDKNNIADNGWTTGKQKIIDDPAFAITDDENIPVGDNYPGDGLTNYEEYRGFMTLKAVEPKAGETGIVSEPVHIRSNYQQKTLFIYCEPFELDIGLFEHISKLETYKLGQGHFIQPDKIDVKGEGISKSGVWLNFNFTQAENVVKQYGLFLKDYLEEKKGSELMGKAFNISQKEKERTRPSPPNWEFQIRIYSTAITTFCADKKLNEAEKKKQVIAHELFHGCNVCHHGEAPGESTDFDLPRYGGLRSGDVNCVMRYDNMTDGKKFPANAPVLPEKTGDILCSSWAGTGYNKPDTNFVTEKITQKGMGDAALNRGACDLQIRISMRGGQPPECRQGEIRKIIGEYVKPK